MSIELDKNKESINKLIIWKIKFINYLNIFLWAKETGNAEVEEELKTTLKCLIKELPSCPQVETLSARIKNNPYKKKFLDEMISLLDSFFENPKGFKGKIIEKIKIINEAIKNVLK